MQPADYKPIESLHVQRERILASVSTTFFNGIGHFLCLSIDINKSTRRDGNHSPRSLLNVFGFFFFHACQYISEGNLVELFSLAATRKNKNKNNIFWKRQADNVFCWVSSNRRENISVLFVFRRN